jgi:serine/threonine protein kinase
MSSKATSAPEAGQTLAGKYLVEEVLGVGGMGIVVSARHLQLDQKVAIKYLLPAALLNPEVVERFAREARAAAKIRGEHVARVIDVGQFDDGAPYMVMEHLEGHDLAKHLDLHGPLPIEDAVRFLLETCEALAEAHAAKIVHRDLKPSNMFLSKQPDKSAIIKVLDFGISKTGDAPSAALTKTSALMGTAFYMSPEQLTNPKGVDHRSDIWSLGVILYELLAGRQPFPGESVPEIIGAILTNTPDGLRTVRPDVPIGLEEVIAKCMQSKAVDRYQSVAGLAAALGPFAHARDRLSIDVTARVLGEAVATDDAPKKTNPNLSKATVLGGQIAQPQQTSPNTMESASAPASAAPPSTAASTPPPSLQAGSSTTGPAVAAVTTHALATSAITTTPKRTPMPLVAGAAAIVIGLAVLGGMKLSSSNAKPDAPPAAAAGLVPAPLVDPHASASAATTTTILPATTTAASPAPDPSPGTSVASTAAGTNGAAPRASTARTPGAPVAAAPASAAAAKSAAPLANAAPPASAAASAPVAAPNSSTKSNPLQMGIK